MRRANLIRAGLLLSMLSFGLAAAPVFDLAWKKSDHTRLAKEVGAYFEAYEESKGVSEAWEDLSNQIAKLQKKLKDQPVLSFIDDWERVFRTEAMSNYKTNPRKGKTIRETLDFNGQPIEVALHFPDKYTTKKEPYPLYLVACEPGKKPDETLNSHWTNADLLASSIICTVRSPADLELLGSLGTPPSEMGGISLLMGAYGLLIRDFAIDMNRVYVAGHDQGIRAAMGTAAAFPHLFAGAIARGTVDAEGVDFPAANFRNLPSLWLAAGEVGTAFEESAQAAGIENATVGAGAGDDEIAAWAADKVRNSYPTHVTFQPVNDYSLASNWVKLDGASVESGSKVEAKVDRETNTITIDVENTVSVILSLNDKLVDLSSPVKVVINGRTQEAQISRNQRTMVDLMYSQGDWGRVFTAIQSYDVDE